MNSLSPRSYEEAIQKQRQKPAKPRKPMSRGTGIRPGKASLSPKARKRRPRKDLMPTRKRLIRDLDSLVSQIVRLRDGRCVECGSTEKLTNGHVLGRRSFATRFDITPDGDCHAQCWPDNFRAARTGAVSYHAWYVRTFGADAFDALYRRWTAGKKWSRLELIALRTELTAKLREMENGNHTQTL